MKWKNLRKITRSALVQVLPPEQLQAHWLALLLGRLALRLAG
jgi:hypothetical protein